MGIAIEVYEYAGFWFHASRDTDGVLDKMTPLEGQHHAAYRDRHARNALEMAIEDEEVRWVRTAHDELTDASLLDHLAGDMKKVMTTQPTYRPSNWHPNRYRKT